MDLLVETQAIRCDSFQLQASPTRIEPVFAAFSCSYKLLKSQAQESPYSQESQAVCTKYVHVLAKGFQCCLGAGMPVGTTLPWKIRDSRHSHTHLGRCTSDACIFRNSTATARLPILQTNARADSPTLVKVQTCADELTRPLYFRET